MWDRVNPEADSHHYEPTGDPYWSAEGRTQVANDQQGRCSSDLVGGRYPGRLTAGKTEPAFYSGHCDTDQAVYYQRLTECR